MLCLLDQKKSLIQGFICAGIKLSTSGNLLQLLQLKVNLYIIYHIDCIPLWAMNFTYTEYISSKIAAVVCLRCVYLLRYALSTFVYALSVVVVVVIIWRWIGPDLEAVLKSQACVDTAPRGVLWMSPYDEDWGTLQSIHPRPVHFGCVYIQI